MHWQMPGMRLSLLRYVVPSPSIKPLPRPLAMHHLLLLQGDQLAWIGRSAFAPDRTVWRDQVTLDPAASPDPLSGAAALFKRALRGRIKAADKLTVLLGYPYVQHMVLPWHASLSNAAKRQEYAYAGFDRQYGAAAAARTVAVDPAQAGLPRLAAAMDTALIEGLQALARTHKLRLVSCTSLLTAAVRRHWDVLEDDCVLSLPQQGAVECLFRTQGTWHAAHSMPTASDAALADSVSAAAAAAKATLPVGNALPVLAVTPFFGGLRQTQDNASPARWLSTAHAWLEGGGSGNISDSRADVDSTAPARAVPDGASRAPDADRKVALAVARRKAIESAAARYRWGYWRTGNLLQQSGKYDAWRIEAWRHPMSCSTYQVIYCWLGAPLSWWRGELQ